MDAEAIRSLPLSLFEFELLYLIHQLIDICNIGALITGHGCHVAPLSSSRRHQDTAVTKRYDTLVFFISHTGSWSIAAVVPELLASLTLFFRMGFLDAIKQVAGRRSKWPQDRWQVPSVTVLTLLLASLPGISTFPRTVT